jgi:hypothetical protein
MPRAPSSEPEQSPPATENHSVRDGETTSPTLVMATGLPPSAAISPPLVWIV